VIKIVIGATIKFNARDFKTQYPNEFRNLRKLFTRKNPTFLSNEKFGYSNHDTEEFIFAWYLEDGHYHFHRGLKRKLFKFLKKSNIEYKVVDITPELDKPNKYMESKITLRDDQPKALEAILKYKEGIVIAFPSFGKCHPAGNRVIMYSGHLKKVEDIKIGDVLMGPDSKPRKVLNTCVGYGDIYEIVPTYGKKFSVNGEHILHLKVGRNPRSKIHKKHMEAGAIHTYTVEEYLKLSNGMKKHLRLWRPKIINFKERKVKYDPYYIGLWIGDGTKLNTSITNNNEVEVINYPKCFAKRNELSLNRPKSGNRCPTFSLVTKGNKKNNLRIYLQKFCVKDNEKYIPQNLILNSEKIRLELLAGLIDSDGYLFCDNKYEFSCKNYRLARQVEYLCLSLGLRANISKNTSSYRKNGEKFFTGFHYRIYISGDTHKIPVKLNRKKAKVKKHIRDISLTSFKVIKKPKKDVYYGFTLDKDHLYILDNFIVNHNTVTALELACRLKQVTTIGVHSIDSQKQWISEIKLHTKIPLAHIGGCGGIYKNPKVGLINVCVEHSLSKERYGKLFGAVTKLFLFDEAQKLSATSFQSIPRFFNCPYRIGVTASIERSDGKKFLITEGLGPIIYKAVDKDSSSKIKARILLVKTGFNSDDYAWSGDRTTLVNELASDAKRNHLIIKRTLFRVKQKKIVLILVERRAHVAILMHLLRKKGIEPRAIMANSSPKSLRLEIKNTFPKYIDSEVLEYFNNYNADKELEVIKELAYHKQIEVVIGTQKAFVGMSIKTLDVLMCTTPTGMNTEQFTQKVGRVERSYGNDEFLLKNYGKKETPIVEYFWDYKIPQLKRSGDNLLENYNRRVSVYKEKK
jgi:superfamily II DNA or RNA helicase